MFPAVTELIPHRPPFLFVDEIVAEKPDGLVARRTWRPEEEFYKGHYPGDPITPVVLLCESILQTAALYIARLGASRGAADGIPMVAKLSEVRFRAPIRPGQTTVTEVRLKEELGGFHLLSGVMTCGTTKVVTAEVAVAWKRPEGRGTGR